MSTTLVSSQNMDDPEDALAEQIRSIEEGRAFVDRSSFHLVEIGGGDARRWLNDLVTAAVEPLTPGRSCRSLLLSPTGRIRADIQILASADAFELVQDPGQPRPIDELLAPYVLSADVRMEAATGRVLLCAPGGGPPPPTARDDVFAPSMLDGGFDLLVGEDRRADAARSMLPRRRVTEDAVREWKIRRGVPTFGIDLDESSLPAEGGLEEDTVDFTKGCFLGQESVAKLRNLGHPPRLSLGLVADGPVESGEELSADGVEVGRITSVSHGDAEPGSTRVLARVRWEARERPLVAPGGVRLVRP
jgi:tRNA-modifying protein YgfZ